MQTPASICYLVIFDHGVSCAIMQPVRTSSYVFLLDIVGGCSKFLDNRVALVLASRTFISLHFGSCVLGVSHLASYPCLI